MISFKRRMGEKVRGFQGEAMEAGVIEWDRKVSEWEGEERVE